MNGDLERSRRLVLGELLRRTAGRYPDKPALIFGKDERTFGELNKRVNCLANALAERGIGARDHVAVLMFNCIEVVETFFACQKLGACPVPVNFRLTQGEVEHVLKNSGAVAIVSGSEFTHVAQSAREASLQTTFHLTLGEPSPRVEAFEEALRDASSNEPRVDVSDEHLAFLMYTSGTTGTPKGAMLTHQNLYVNTLNWVHEMEARPEDVWLSGLPLFHIGGVNGILPFIYLGGTTVLTASTGFDPAAAIEWLNRHEVTMCFFVATQWQQICDFAEACGVQAPSLRTAMWGASPAPRATVESITKTFPDVEVVNAFGQTEMSSNTTFLKGKDATRKIGSIGRPVVGLEVRIINDAGDDVRQGEVGEIVYRGATVMAGYYNDATATAEAFAGGWFHSGDLVREDEEGFLYVVDRKKDMIISGGENIYPAELEHALHQHPAVREVAVIGVPHPKWVETPLAVVVATAGVDADESDLIDFCRERLASYKKPSRVVFVDELPRSAAGKVMKRELRARFHHLASDADAMSEIQPSHPPTKESA